ncbi:long-chain fatty acid--CoA ligase [Skermanella sp. TT6]|uniref:Long-chain fatty acid--CoA ligase n=1 Tax=Skermanella cutis TaxID=2775420 RepID=A0ABX7BD10_9PROT|nr:long-chain fatty acid--CoA ligase [Skermanella sp. TT6]QQP90317.1 long-chain fatty acid--CoA ligase [Skermanella sp. TT6]
MADPAANLAEFPWARSYPTDIDWHADIPTAPLHRLMDDAVARFGDRPCIDFMDKRYTYAQIGALVDKAARGFQDMGVGKGSKVGLFLPNTPYFVICYYGVLKAGGTVVNFNPLYAEREIAKQIEDSDTDIMVTLDLAVLYGKIAKMLSQTRLKRIVVARMADILPFPKNWLFPIVKRKDVARIPSDDRHLAFSRLVANAGRPAPVEIDPDEDVAVLQYTGGTTGVPKGAMLTHANIYANAIQSRLWCTDARPGHERMLGVLPLFHVFAMTGVMNLPLVLGAEMVLVPRFELDNVIRLIQSKKPTLFPAVPTIYTAIVNHKDIGSYDLSSIRFCLSGGAPLPVEVKHAFETKTGCKLVEGYGLSESSPVATANPMYGVNKAGSIGIPLPGTVIEIVSLDDRSRLVPPGEKGEVCIRGPQVMKGYWKRPGETAEALADGRLHTGDVGYMDEDGYTFIVDRIKDMILCGGYNVYPRNVEEAIYLHPAVAECVVAGVPDPYRGQTVKAYVKLAEGHGLTREDLAEFLRDKLSPIEIPKHLELRDELPKTMIGKLSRKALLEEEEARRSGRQSTQD